MDQELKPLIVELCHIAVTRNEINTRRHRARYRKNYYAHAIKVVEAHNGSNSILRKIHPDSTKYAAKIAQIKHHMEWLKKQHPNPVKWKAMGLHKLRSLMLQGAGEYALAKHETMEFSIKTRGRVRELCEKLDCHVIYKDGAISQIIIAATHPISSLTLPDIKKYADQYDLDKAITDMIQDQDE